MKWSNFLIDPAAHYTLSMAQDWLSDNCIWCRPYTMKQTVHHTKKWWGCRLDDQLIHAAFMSYSVIPLMLYSIRKHHLSCHFFNPFLQFVVDKNIYRVSHAELLSSFQISLQTSSSKGHWMPRQLPLSVLWTHAETSDICTLLFVNFG